MQKKIAVFLIFFLVFILASCIGRQEMEDLTLFENFEGKEIAQKSSNFVTPLRRRPVDINIQAVNRLLDTERDLDRIVELNLFPNEEYVVLFEEPVWRTANGYTLTGEIIGEPTSEVYLAVTGDLITMNILGDSGEFLVEYNGDYHEVFQLSENKKFNPGSSEKVYKNLDISQNSSSIYHSVEVDSIQNNEKSKIDLFFVFSSAAKDSAGGLDNLQNYINLAISQTNQSFENSMIDLEVQLILMGETPIEPESHSEALYCITEKEDGCLDEVHPYRDQYYADIVIFIIDDDSYCGLSWLIKNQNEYSEQNAFSVVNWRCLASQFALAREIGKIMGAQTDVDSAPADEGAFEYSRGYVAQDQSFRTIMAMDCGLVDCPRVNYWSNPYLSLNGQPLGEVGVADNHQTLNEIGPIVSDYRVPPSPPESITLLSPEDQSEYGTYPIMYGWYQDDMATQYRIKVENQATGEEIFDEYLSSSAVCGSLLCTYTPDIVLDSGDYIWQVAGVNSVGEGGLGEGHEFYIPFEAPVTITPSENDIIFSTRPIFQWEEVPGATSYDFGLNSRSGSTIISLNLMAEDICQDQVCQFRPDTSVSIDDYYWDVRAKRTIGGDWSSQVSFTVAALTAPEILSPEDGFSTTDHTPNFDWADHPDAEGYFIQVSPTSDFTVLPIVKFVTISRYTPGMAMNNQGYWWRVCSVAGGSLSDWSEARTFSITGAPGQQVPTLISPEDGFATNNDQPTFSWERVAEAERYRIQISRVPDFRELFINTETTETSYTPGKTMGTGTFYWRIQAIGGGDVSWFTIKRELIIE